jgi:isopentenyl-diphosphate Delta-isomerase
MAQDELVDIVDESGNFIEVITKQEAHKKGLLHKTVIGQVINSKGLWLLARQAKDRQDAGQYVAPVGGHVTAGETEIDALKREANEEIGFKENFKYEFISKGIFNRYVLGRQENHFFVIYKIFSDEEPIPGPEDDGYRYFTEKELKKELKENPKLFGDAFHFGVKACFPHLIKL